jgi:Fe2+ transport system protein FeoA
MRLAFSSERPRVQPLSSLAVGQRGVVVDVHAPHGTTASLRVERLLSLGVSPGAAVTLLQRFPGVVFLCDQTELAIERGVADAVLVRLTEQPS